MEVENVDIDRETPNFVIANDYLLFRFFNYKSSRPVRSLTHLSKEKMFSFSESPSAMISLNEIINLPSFENRLFTCQHLGVSFLVHQIQLENQHVLY